LRTLGRNAVEIQQDFSAGSLARTKERGSDLARVATRPGKDFRPRETIVFVLHRGRADVQRLADERLCVAETVIAARAPSIALRRRNAARTPVSKILLADERATDYISVVGELTNHIFSGEPP
jgi:hypothetical protein